MLTPRSVVTLILLAALVLVVAVGVANWSTTLRREPAQARGQAVASTGRTARPQLGRSVHHGPFDQDVESSEVLGRQPFASRRADPSADVTFPGAHVGRLGVGPETALAMRDTRALTTPDPTRRPDPMLFGTGHSSPFVDPGAAAPSSGLATVDFIAVLQSMKSLQHHEFLAPDVRELKINVWWNVPGAQTQRLELFAPDGTLYRRMSLAFDGDVVAKNKTPVETRLPVGGTWITEYSLFGAWRVDVYLSGQPAPVTSASFVLYN